MRQKSSRSLSDRINGLPKWARDYINQVSTEEVEELMVLREQRSQLLKLVSELKAENRRLRKKLEGGTPNGD